MSGAHYKTLSSHSSCPSMVAVTCEVESLRKNQKKSIILPAITTGMRRYHVSVSKRKTPCCPGKILKTNGYRDTKRLTSLVNFFKTQTHHHPACEQEEYAALQLQETYAGGASTPFASSELELRHMPPLAFSSATRLAISCAIFIIHACSRMPPVEPSPKEAPSLDRFASD